MIVIYTDGASRGNPGPGGWGAIIIYDDKVVELGGGETHTTNNRMELTAAIKALEFISEKKIIIYADSEYVTKGMTEWIKRWQKKSWRTAGRKPVLNQDLWQKLLLLIEGREVKWKYVAGHSGIPLNERADEIATTFADGLDPALYDGPKDKYK
ncbi:MAG: ribonuclease HI [Candidatus Zambryskibacteria bacterium RIFCSPHIGHO2_01_FULL_46_30]|uniref:Ribonuclease H n=1 Tax=Candidatus Zambryskibacteria bacterium RIFCSPHIGHO2_01_FULL_46_30 TaxID=1802739 RepID=A0A1G2T233_9BACT|nr:MAG: ribonuclease HI [Candidatus Zambryskibacteria bacterium RIFCSPHIGHO2_01_FULL_46_30]OHB05378.1 MAG: ribonuclease HI [Candidatus Zambryskibacteria bacterium RIFCSPLOWO2_01_FULL_47_33]